MTNKLNGPDIYSPETLAKKYGLSIQQARRHINRLGALRTELDSFLASSLRTDEHRSQDIERTVNEVSYG
ncbi:hypothetical protein [Rhizobium herbae]|uniref:RNA polymerase sigma-70 region 4 domain-containing protein n=1 Tax=Rhizobium herbae TaxID=508661 RepID=A0ABS4EVY8_9HYPH|nr:hypothetical protein [Rhizobium herbae]MBP1862120.1 hypothetical protein [Rhizobium herbae]